MRRIKRALSILLALTLTVTLVGFALAEESDAEAPVGKAVEESVTKSNDESVQEPETEPEKEPEKPAVDTAKTKTIPVKLPTSPESLNVVAKLNGAEVYNATHKASDGVVNITFKGTGTATVEILINGQPYISTSISF